ncbi:hypothetical protein GGI20_002471 [Coemansia sp. BCRC 34301]|nr:hypothetical protein GGI20_002471 [Coemansia sp. BCRC 34301]
MSYNKSAYDQYAHGQSVDITSMQQPVPPPPPAMTYSEAAWQTPTTSKKKKDRSSVIGMDSMGHWSALRFIMYVGTRLTQVIVAIVCIGYLAQSRSQRPSSSEGGDKTERDTEIAVFAVAGVTAATAFVSIVLHLFAKTRQRIEKSRTAWFTLALNFAIFVTWIILVLINVVVVDCSRKADGSWCHNLKASLATGLVSAMLALVVVLRSFSVLVRADRINLSK